MDNRRVITIRINPDIYDRIIEAATKASLNVNSWCIVTLTEALDRPTWASLSKELAQEMIKKGVEK